MNLLLLSNVLAHRAIYTGKRLPGTISKRFLTHDGRNRRSTFWVPTFKAPERKGKDDPQSLLVTAGFIRQAHSGLFQFLPLGLRVQERLERLLDKHMRTLGASKVALSTLSSEELWHKSGRLQGDRSELFRLEDRKGAKYLLSPTHEEEITSLVGGIVHSYRDLPLRLYQITRKYRDEPRPRQGLLRSREFLMKDLYTFNATKKDALETYQIVRKAYSAFFDELKVPYLIAEADSGNIGGDLSHEYHVVTPIGEDSIISCDNCDYAANEEVARSGTTAVWDERLPKEAGKLDPNYPLFRREHGNLVSFTGLDRLRKKSFTAFLPRKVTSSRIGQVRNVIANLHVLKKIFPTMELNIRDPSEHINEETIRLSEWVFDRSIPESMMHDPLSSCPTPWNRTSTILTTQPALLFPITTNLVAPAISDPCPLCPNGTLRIQKAVELGHTFHLGTKYSVPLSATVASDPSILPVPPTIVPLEMGCHGIGVSRLLATIASTLATPATSTRPAGLNWPRCIAPFECVVIAAPNIPSAEAEAIYDLLAEEGLEVILDDRAEKSMVWKLKDADLVGYPVVVLLGRGWRTGMVDNEKVRRDVAGEQVLEEVLIGEKFLRGKALVEEMAKSKRARKWEPREGETKERVNEAQKIPSWDEKVVEVQCRQLERGGRKLVDITEGTVNDRNETNVANLVHVVKRLLKDL